MTVFRHYMVLQAWTESAALAANPLDVTQHPAPLYTRTFLSCPLNSDSSDPRVQLNIEQMHGTVRCGAQPNLQN